MQNDLKTDHETLRLRAKRFNPLVAMFIALFVFITALSITGYINGRRGTAGLFPPMSMLLQKLTEFLPKKHGERV